MKRVKRVLDRWRRRYFPTPHELMVDKWWADGGDEALRFNYDLNENSTVLDLGGYRGQWASDLFAMYRCRIYVFEPAASFAELITKRFARNERIEVLPFGLGGSSRTETIHLCADGSSVFRASGATEQIKLVDAEEWLQERNISECELIKINIEGGEYELLERLLATGLITRFRDIQVQFHDLLPDSAARMEKIQEGLRKTHRPTYQYRFVWENWTRLNG